MAHKYISARATQPILALSLILLAGVGRLSAEHQESTATTIAKSAIFADRHVPDSGLDVHRKAMRMSYHDRFAFLAEWILPGKRHDSLRLSIDFAPTHPAPPGALNSPLDVARQELAGNGAVRVETGGGLISPVLDLMAAAKASQALDQLSERVAIIKSDSAVQQRAKLAVQVLIEITRHDFTAANQSLGELLPAIGGMNSRDPVDRTVATLVAWTALQHAETRETAEEFVANIQGSMQHGVRTGSEAWDAHLFMLAGFSRYLREFQGAPHSFGLAPPLKQWSSVSRPSARSRGEGWPVAHWQVVPESGAWGQRLRVDSLAGHHQDYLYFQSPLRGDFHVECEVTAGDWAEGHLLVAGHWFAPFESGRYSSGTIRDEFPRRALQRSRMPAGEWMRYRASVTNGVLSVFFDGHNVTEVKLPPDYDPWIAIRSRSHNQSGVRDVRISGHPSVPESLNLASSPELIGWYSYYGEAVGRPDAAWRLENDVLVGKRMEETRGQGILPSPVPLGRTGSLIPRGAPYSGVESLLQYHRPLLEDGIIEYEFYYRPGFAAHPALDRLVLLLEKDGVKTHWLTDGVYERTAIDSVGSAVEPGYRRGPAQLPLIDDQWNKVAVALTGNTLQLTLNGQVVHRRRVARTNQRYFGLFHFSDHSEVRVRNVLWRGNWARYVPPIAQQELADLSIHKLVTRSLELPMAWEHDFAGQGLPAARFQSAPAEGVLQPGGLLVAQRGTDQWTEQITSGRVQVSGDFDIAATFERLSTSLSNTTDEAALIMQIGCADEADLYHMGRRSFRQSYEIVEAVQNPLSVDGRGKAIVTTIPQASNGGTFRIIRQGDRIGFLFAEGTSGEFRLVDEQPAVSTDTPSLGIRLLTQAQGRNAETRVVWKKIAIRATEIQSPPSALPN